MANKDSSKPIPERWMEVSKEKRDGSIVSYYICPESGQKFNTYEDLMRYVNYAKAAKLSIYSPNFRPIGQCKPKEKAGILDIDLNEKSSGSEDYAFELPSPLEPMEVASPGLSDKQSVSGKTKLGNQASNEGCSSSKGKGKKQKR
ncbi:hypothetical protein DITRI_Ditri11bG0156400 [Diplodiscus trichospermus]